MTRTNYADWQTPQFRVLSDAQCHEIYLAALECLYVVGLQVHYQPARELLAAAGARLDGKHVYISSHLVQDALTSTPPTFTLWSRDHSHKLYIAPGRAYFGPGPTCTYFHDPYTGERRKARRGDPGAVAKVCEALENIDFVMGLSQLDDVTPELSPVYEFAEMIANTQKPLLAWSSNAQTLADIHQIAIAAVGDQETLRRKPTYALFTSYGSPLRLGESALDNIFWAVEHDIPVIMLGGPTEGVESPFTGASALVLHLAAALGGLTITQLKKRGAAAMIGGIPAAMDLYSARPAYGSPEMMLHTAAAAEVAHYLGVPFMGTAGASESKMLDSQAAIEISLQILMSALSGGGLVHDVGFLDCADIGSLALLVMADEVIGMVKSIMRGIQVNRQTIMLDLIEKVGPGGHFLAEPESAKLCRSEIWTPALLDRKPYPIWEKYGGKSMEERVNEKLHTILEGTQPATLPQGASEKIEAILLAAQARHKTDV